MGRKGKSPSNTQGKEGQRGEEKKLSHRRKKDRKNENKTIQRKNRARRRKETKGSTENTLAKCQGGKEGAAESRVRSKNYRNTNGKRVRRG